MTFVQASLDIDINNFMENYAIIKSEINVMNYSLITLTGVENINVNDIGMILNYCLRFSDTYNYK